MTRFPSTRAERAMMGAGNRTYHPLQARPDEWYEQMKLLRALQRMQEGTGRGKYGYGGKSYAEQQRERRQALEDERRHRGYQIEDAELDMERDRLQAGYARDLQTDKLAGQMQLAELERDRIGF